MSTVRDPIVDGSLSQRLAEHAGRPMLVVPPPR
jgi:hypothetical protein